MAPLPPVRSAVIDTISYYSRFRGTPPKRLAAEEFIHSRRSGLTGLRTQHLCSNHLATVEGDRVRCRCDFVIHRRPTQKGDMRFLHTDGYYHYGFVRAANGRWSIDSIEQIAIRSEGSPEPHGAHRTAAGTPV